MPYDELGNYIPDDSLTLDEMRYALAHSGQKSPPPGYEYAKPGRMPLRTNGSDVPMLPEEVAQTLVPIPPPEPKKPYSTATNFPQAVADRLGISAIPQAIMAMGAGFGSEVAKGTGNKELSEAMRYEPTSRITNDVLAGLEQAPKTITGSHMGFGPMPETWVTGLGTVSPNDIRVIAKQNIERAREAARIREDFVNAQSGIRRESALGGDTYGAALQRAADDLADMQARNQARRSEYATPMTGSVQVFGNLMPENAMYAVRPSKSAGSIIREVPTPLNPAYSATGDSRLSEDLMDIVDRQAPRTENEKSYQHMTQFTNFMPEGFNKSAQDMFRDYVNPILAQEFPGTDPSDYGRAVHAKYGNNANEWYKKQLESFATLPEVQQHNELAFKTAMSDPDIPNPFEFLRDVLIVPPSAEFKGKKASDEWVMNNLQNYLTEHVGTPTDPALKLIAETGKTGFEMEKLDQLVGNRRLSDEAKDIRARAGMPTEGTFEKDIDKTRNLLGQNNLTIELLQNKENELIEANPGVRPQDISGWAEARKEVTQATKRKDETAKKLDNLMKAQAVENYNDTQHKIINEEEFTKGLEPYFKERYPMLPTNKDVAFQMRVPAQFRDLAKDVQNRLAISGAPGVKNVVKAEDVGSYSVPKAIQIKAELLAQREKMGEQAAKMAEQKLVSHIKARTESIPKDGTYGPATVARITKDLGADQIKADISDITQWMDHCIGRGGSPEKRTPSPLANMLGMENVPSDVKWRQYIPMVQPHLGNRVPAGSSGAATTYVKSVIGGESDIVDFRDTATGIPYATLKLNITKDPGLYQLGEFYGYQDGTVTGPMVPGRGREYSPEEDNTYRQAIADWANDHQDQLRPTGNDYLMNHAEIYDLQSPDYKNSLARQLGVNVKEANEVAHTMGKRFVTLPEAKELWNNRQVTPIDTIEDLRGRRDELAIELREAEDPDSSYEPEAIDDLRYSIEDLDTRIAEMENRPPVGARAVTQATQVQPNWNRTVNQIREDTRTQLDEIDAFTLAAAIDETQNRFTFSQQPHEFVAELERRADYYEGRNQPEVAHAIRNVAMGYDSQIINDPTPQAQNQVAMRVNEPYITVRNALQHLVDANDVEAMQGIADNIMTNQNGPYGQLDDTQRNRLRQQLHGAIDRIQSEQQIRPLEGIVEEGMNMIRDQYGENTYNVVDRILTSINDNYDIGQDPVLFIERIRQHAGQRDQDASVRDVMNHMADELVEGVRHNNQIQAAQNRVAAQQNQMVAPGLEENTALTAPTGFTDDQLDDIASDYLNNLEGPTPQMIRQEADDMRNGMTDLPELTPLNDAHRRNAQNEIAMRMEQHADMMDDMEEPPTQAPALPAPEVQRTPEQNAINEALHFPRHWYQRYPDLPHEVVTGVMHRIGIQHAPPDFAGMRDYAAQGMRRTIFENLNPVQQRQAVAMIDDIANDYQNRIQRLDNQTAAQPERQYNTVVNAYLGILDANNQFAGQEGLDTLRALPQLLRRQNLRQEFGIANLSVDERNNLITDFEELYESRMRNPQLPPPGHKRGGYIKKKMMKNGGEYNLPDLGNDEEEPKYSKPFQPPAIPYAYPGVSGARINRAMPIDRNSAVTLSADVSKRQDQGGTNYNVNEFGGGYHHKVGPGMLGISGSHRPGTHENRVNLMYAIPMNEGGKVEPSAPSSGVNDQSKPVMPIKKIHNPDAPEFKDILIRERAIRSGGTQPGGPSADMKQLMNPRNISYAKGGRVHMNDGGMPDFEGSYVMHPDVQRLVANGQIDPADARWMSDYAHTKGNTTKEGTGAWKDQSEKMQNFVGRMERGEIPIPEHMKGPETGVRVGGNSAGLNPKGAGGIGGGGGRADVAITAPRTSGGGGSPGRGGPSADIKQIMNPRNISYADGGNVSLDAMRYELLRKQ
jgi:hypothetical protein